MKTKKLKILENSLIKKESLFDEKISEHFATVRQANGQPLNDKRNGQATLNKWERQSNALKTLQEGIEKTKQAIERERNKIINSEHAKESFPKCILDMIESGQLIQWRKNPNTFFIDGVDKARIVWDNKKKLIFTRYRNTITDQATWKIFASTFNTLLKSIQNEQNL